MQTVLVLEVLLQEPSREVYGLELSEKTGLLPGTTYPILQRLEKEGWVTSHWEDIDPSTQGRPARRYYRFTNTGASLAADAVARARRPIGDMRPRLAKGSSPA